SSGPSAPRLSTANAGNISNKPITRRIGMRCAPFPWEIYVFTTPESLKGKNPTERFLSLFAPVHRGEGVTALLLMMNVFVLLMAYYIIKPVREALILGGAGAEIKSYAGAGQALLFLLIVPLYSAYASRTNRVRLINGVTAFFISNLAIFYFLG